MKIALKASLEAKIEEWIGENCEESTWVDCVLPENLAGLMMAGAANVLESIEIACQYLEDQDYLKSTRFVAVKVLRHDSPTPLD